MKLAVFAYNFPHKKTQDFVLRLFLEGFDIGMVLACDPVPLDLPRSVLRTKARHIDLLHPELLCRRLRIPYHVVSHNSPQTVELVSSQGIDLGVVAGARILKKNIIGAFKLGVMNIHPGLIPEVRGLDTLQWALMRDLPIGVTAHLVDERVDAGRIILREQVTLYKDDTLVDISLRLSETQVTMLPKVLNMVKCNGIENFPPVVSPGKSNPPMPPELQLAVPRKLAERLSKLP